MTKEGLSLRAYARHRGVSATAVSKAVHAGRLRECLLPDGRIRDASEADAEWAANTRSDRVPLTGPTSHAPPPPSEPGGPVPDYAASRARREAAEASLAELELAKEEGRLVEAAEVEARIADDYGKVRTKLLGVPSRVRQQDPTLTAAQLALLDKVIRAALEDLAVGAEVTT